MSGRTDVPVTRESPPGGSHGINAQIRSLRPANPQVSDLHTLVRAAGRVTSQGCLGGAVVTRGTLILPPYFDPGLMLDLIAAERAPA